MQKKLNVVNIFQGRFLNVICSAVYAALMQAVYFKQHIKAKSVQFDLQFYALDLVLHTIMILALSIYAVEICCMHQYSVFGPANINIINV